MVHADGIIALTGGSDRITEAFDLLTAGQGQSGCSSPGSTRKTSEEALMRQQSRGRGSAGLLRRH